ncbi:MAG: divergent polysaccharide deacetylase family protein [Thermodesulfobacteriota bacterium]|nr:divergent polysaccharide deacetylase family protein [Thermodesulfobacteriota bacterium]
MKKKKNISVILAILSIMVLLTGVAIYLEYRLTQKELIRQAQKVSAPIVPIKLSTIKGCLFDLNIQKKDARIKGHTITVSSPRKLSEKEIRNVFYKFKKQGADVHIKNNKYVSIGTDKTSWRILFKYPKRRASRIAIIVDDMGLNMDVAKELGKIDADITFAIMPMRPYSKEVATYLHNIGKEIILHLPMEGSNDKDPGAGALYKNMSPAEVRSILLKDISSVPYISGVNNHMGSEVTPDKAIMTTIAKELKKKRLYYVDSLTTNKSVCKEVAKKVDLPFASRDVFLDNVDSYAYIRDQLDKLVTIGEKCSCGIGTCHPHPTTIAVLKREIPRLKEQGVVIEPISIFVHE